MNRVVFTFGLLIMLMVTFFLYTSANACTEFIVKADDGVNVVGRSMEFGFDLKSQVVVQPRGDEFTMPEVEGQEGMHWENKFGYAYLNGNETTVIADGMNEKGLSVGCLYMPEYAVYQKVNKTNADRAIPNDLLGHWLLGNFERVDEIKKQLPEMIVYGHEVEWVGGELPLHYSVYERSGKGIVIEYTKDGLRIYDNEIGVMTNSPPFDWHLENLQNYLGLKSNNPEAEKVDKYLVKPAGQGFGMIGLPGDYTPPSRLVRVLALRSASDKVDDEYEAANLALHLLNTVDIPKGTVRPAKNEKQDHFDYTQWIVIKDLKNLKLYYRTYSSISVQMIDLMKIDFEKESGVRKISLTEKPIVVEQTWKVMEAVK
ncbi:choloylglycine hydrolase family protein [Planctomycetota bacterium]|nr:choloylglycine hydrolase family protein [Planctomycetota bacterium]